jgi:hypothetical protein
MKSRKLVTSRRLALMASRAVCLSSWQPRHQQDEEAAGEDAKTGGADTEPSTENFHEHDCTSHPARLRAGLTQWLKATVIFWTRTLHDSDAYRDPQLA